MPTFQGIPIPELKKQDSSSNPFDALFDTKN